MADKIIPMDFDIENMMLDGRKVVLPKFVKAMVRIMKGTAERKKKIVIAYPHYFSRFTSVMTVAAYFHFMRVKHSRTEIKILVVCRSERTLLELQQIANSFGTNFLDFVYTGLLDASGFRRLKPYGSGRGSPSAKLELKHAVILIVKPSFIAQVADQPFDMCLIEDCQFMLKKQYYEGLEKLSGLSLPILAIMTAPDARAAGRFQQHGFQIVGWDEDLLASDARQNKDNEAFGLEETAFPSVNAIELPLDPYHTTINLAWNAFGKSRRLARGLEDDNLKRVFVQLARIIHSLMNLSVNWEFFGRIQEAAGKHPITWNLALARTFISQFPRGLSDRLELETVLNLCETALSLTPTKENYYMQNVGDSTVHFVAASDDITAEAMKGYFKTKRGLNIITPDSPDQIRKSRVVLNGLTGKLADDYKIIKKIRAERIDVLLYQHEKGYLEWLKKSRGYLRNALDKRKDVFRELGIIGQC